MRDMKDDTFNCKYTDRVLKCDECTCGRAGRDLLVAATQRKAQSHVDVFLSKLSRGRRLSSIL